MKIRNLSLFFLVLVTSMTTIQAQEKINPEQNPNYQISLTKYLESKNDYIVYQGTTSQETYTAIDPMEQKRKLKSLRKQHRANSRLWRHQERIARIENTQYYQYGGSDSAYYPYRSRRNNWNYGQSLFNLGVLGYLIFR